MNLWFAEDNVVPAELVEVEASSLWCNVKEVEMNPLLVEMLVKDA